MNASLIPKININIKTLSAEPYYAKGQEISEANIPKKEANFLKDFSKMCQIKNFILIRGYFI